MMTPSPYQFFLTPKIKTIRRHRLSDGREVIFSQVGKTIQAHVNGIKNFLHNV